MRSPRELVKAVARAVLNAVSGGYVGDLIVDVVPGVAHDVWDWWGKNRGDAERKAELEALAQTPPAEMRQQVAEIVQEAAPDQPAQVQAQLVSYLTQDAGSRRLPPSGLALFELWCGKSTGARRHRQPAESCANCRLILPTLMCRNPR